MERFRLKIISIQLSPSVINCNENKECEDYVNKNLVITLKWNGQTYIPPSEIDLYKIYYTNLFYKNKEEKPIINSTIGISSFSLLTKLTNIPTETSSPTIFPSPSPQPSEYLTKKCLRGSNINL